MLNKTYLETNISLLLINCAVNAQQLVTERDTVFKFAQKINAKF